ncbi:histidine kinase [Flavobacteriaceae bacterium 3-367]|uniref:sensor histidine kinase n=1 Tax=Eudoraea algarum TaxID=3417568 RepID=UPI00328F9E3A
MFKSKAVKKFVFRWMVVNVVYLMVKLTIDHEEEMESFFTATSAFYYFSAFFLFMLTWEINDWLLRRQKRKGGLDFKSSLRILGKTMAISLPMSALVYYLALFPFRETIGIVCVDPALEFRTDFLRAALLGATVIFFNMFHFSMNQRDEMKQQMEDLKKEMMASRYTSLRSQISPHFLFNSLNTLTSLMYEDRDLASDFVTRLASSYRYILDTGEEDLISLEKELNFLDSFVFMMNVRHKDAVIIKTDVDLPSEKYQIPTLSLQMLVENALKHNHYSKERPLHISISSIGNEALVIKNNLRKRILKEETTQVGLKNIKKRYAHYTNKLVLVREEDGIFEVILPLLAKDVKELNLLSVS